MVQVNLGLGCVSLVIPEVFKDNRGLGMAERTLYLRCLDICQ